MALGQALVTETPTWSRGSRGCKRTRRPSGQLNQCSLSIQRGEAEQPYLAGALLVFNSTKTSSNGLSPTFSGKCSPASDHWTDPAFTGAS